MGHGPLPDRLEEVRTGQPHEESPENSPWLPRMGRGLSTLPLPWQMCWGSDIWAGRCLALRPGFQASPANLTSSSGAGPATHPSGSSCPHSQQVGIWAGSHSAEAQGIGVGIECEQLASLEFILMAGHPEVPEGDLLVIGGPEEVGLVGGAEAEGGGGLLAGQMTPQQKPARTCSSRTRPCRPVAASALQRFLWPACVTSSGLSRPPRRTSH